MACLSHTIRTILEFQTGRQDSNLALKAVNTVVDNKKTITGSKKKTEVDLEPDTTKDMMQNMGKLPNKNPGVNPASIIVPVKENEEVLEAAPIVDNIIDSAKELVKSRKQIQKELDGAASKSYKTEVLMQIQREKLKKQLERAKQEKVVDESVQGAEGILYANKQIAQQKLDKLRKSGKAVPGEVIHIAKGDGDKVYGHYVVPMDKKANEPEFKLKTNSKIALLA